MIIRLFVAAAGQVVFEDAPFRPFEVVPDVKRHNDQPLEYHGQVRLYHLAELVSLPLTGQLHPFQLFIMFEFGLKQLRHFNAGTRRPGNRHGRILVDLKNLLDPAFSDLKPLCRAPISGNDDALLISDRQHCGRLGDRYHGWTAGPQWLGQSGLRLSPPASAGCQLRMLPGQEIKETRVVVIRKEGKFHYAFNLASNASAVSDWSSNSAVSDSVPRNGSINGTFLIVVLPMSNNTDVQLAP